MARNDTAFYASDGERDHLMAMMQTHLIRSLWLWMLGEAWFTALITGAVPVQLWARYHVTPSFTQTEQELWSKTHASCCKPQGGQPRKVDLLGQEICSV